MNMQNLVKTTQTNKKKTHRVLFFASHIKMNILKH